MDKVEKYIQTFPEDIQMILRKIRTIVKERAPLAKEGIAYGMPAYKLNRTPLIYFAAFKNHIGLYALPSGHQRFADRLSSYKHGKGSVQFPYDRDIPYDLIAEIVDFRVGESTKKQNK